MIGSDTGFIDKGWGVKILYVCVGPYMTWWFLKYESILKF